MGRARLDRIRPGGVRGTGRRDVAGRLVHGGADSIPAQIRSGGRSRGEPVSGRRGPSAAFMPQ
ncbi:hypothetical protein A33M_3432 [Rhodovulum sp. PH10]|nr:hypothetical protein A33M_3432 [Rhodovulum sp. PH10]